MKSILNFFAQYNGKRVFAGALGEDKVFRKTVEVRDKLLKRNAFGLDKMYMDDAVVYGIRQIELTVTDSGQVFIIDIATFKEKALVEKIGKFGSRYYCPLEFWQERPAKVRRAPK